MEEAGTKETGTKCSRPDFPPTAESRAGKGKKKGGKWEGLKRGGKR